MSIPVEKKKKFTGILASYIHKIPNNINTIYERSCFYEYSI